MIVTLMFTLALIVGTSQERTVEALKANAPAVKAWGGRIMLLIGVWFIALGVFAGFFADVFPV
jgi:hypothetical protein